MRLEIDVQGGGVRVISAGEETQATRHIYIHLPEAVHVVDLLGEHREEIRLACIQYVQSLLDEKLVVAGTVKENIEFLRSKLSSLEEMSR